MHEFGIAQGLLDAVLTKAQEMNAMRITAIKLQIGVMSGIEIDALEFAFGAVAANTPAATSRLMIDIMPVRCYCERCKNIFESTPAAYACPVCGEVSADLRSGRELKLISMEID